MFLDDAADRDVFVEFFLAQCRAVRVQRHPLLLFFAGVAQQPEARASGAGKPIWRPSVSSTNTMRPDTQTRVAQCSSSVMEEFMPFLLEEILMLEDRCFYAAQFGWADVAAAR